MRLRNSCYTNEHRSGLLSHRMAGGGGSSGHVQSCLFIYPDLLCSQKMKCNLNNTGHKLFVVCRGLGKYTARLKCWLAIPLVGLWTLLCSTLHGSKGCGVH